MPVWKIFALLCSDSIVHFLKFSKSQVEKQYKRHSPSLVILTKYCNLFISSFRNLPRLHRARRHIPNNARNPMTNKSATCLLQTRYRKSSLPSWLLIKDLSPNICKNSMFEHCYNDHRFEDGMYLNFEGWYLFPLSRFKIFRWLMNAMWSNDNDNLYLSVRLMGFSL